MPISLNDVQRGYDRWAAKPHNAKWVRKIDGTPIANDIVVNIFDELRDSATTETSKPVAEAVKVKQQCTIKPLEWELCEDGETYHAQSILGRWAYWDGHYLTPDSYGGIKSPEPKAAAQADYEARIMSALTPQAGDNAEEPVAWQPIETCPKNRSVILQCMWKHQLIAPYVFEGYLDWDGVTWRYQDGKPLKDEITSPVCWQAMPKPSIFHAPEAK